MKSDQNPSFFSPEEITSALDRISDSGVLGSKSRIQMLLKYLVQMEITGQGDRLKAFTIATEALGRGNDFDPGTDSIVRVEVNRLRQALDHYYNTQGAEDTVRIKIPKGIYRPRFLAFEATLPESPVSSEGRASIWSSRRVLAFAALTALAVAILVVKSSLEHSLPTSQPVPERPPPQDQHTIKVAVLPFKNLTASARSAQLSSGIARELRSSLSRNQALSLITQTPFDDGASTQDTLRLEHSSEVSYFITGAVQEVSNALRVAVELVDRKSGKVVWARTYHQESMELEAFRDRFVSSVSNDLRPQFYSASKRTIAAKDPDDLSAWELYLMATWVPGEAISTLEWEKERVELASRSVKLRPEFGQAHAVLADKLAYLAAVDPPSNSSATLEKAEYHAQIAYELAPSDADTLFNLAIHHWHFGQIEKATRDMARVLELDPNHVLARILVKTFPYTCVAPPDDLLQEVMTYDTALASDNPVRWVTLTWLSMLHLNRGELDLALAAEQRTHQIFQTPDTTLRMAALLNGLDRVEDARALIAAQRRNWPHIDSRHFAEVTMPRRCHEASDAEKTLQLYQDLARDAGAD